MKFNKKLLGSSVAAAVIAASAAAPSAYAEVSASATVASSYHWRGFDLGSGTPAVSADLVYSNGGFYGGMWVSSGDTAAGTEYDLFAGYGGEVGGFSYDVSVISYIYPTGAFEEGEGPFDFMEAIVSLGYSNFGFFLHTNIAGAEATDTDPRYAFIDGEYMYYGLTAEFGDYSFVLGQHDENDFNGDDVTELAPGVTGDLTHLDGTYAYNDNLSFTLSVPLGSELGDSEPSPKFVASYSLPIE